MQRRTLLARTVGAIGAAGLVGKGSARRKQIERSSDRLFEGKPEETEIYQIDTDQPGPVGLVLGGFHGDEEAGYMAAERLTRCRITAGKLVLIPRVNEVGIEQGTRAHGERDPNRQYLLGERPTTELARGIWFVTATVDPDFVLTLHESRGLYSRSPSGVGQAVFYGPERVAATAERVVTETNTEFGLGSRYRFVTDAVDPYEKRGLYTHKTSVELGTPSYLVETFEGVPLRRRIDWQTSVARGLLAEYGLLQG